MEQIINFTEEELTDLKEELTTELSKMKGNTRRKKLKLVGKTLLKLILIAGGVTVAIVFPSTIVLAVPCSVGWLRYWMGVRERLSR